MNQQAKSYDPTTLGQPDPDEPGTLRDEEGNVLPTFDPKYADPFSGLLYLGALSDHFEWLGHEFDIRTLRDGEKLAVASIIKPYVDTMGADRAYACAVVGMAITGVDGDNLSEVAVLGLDYLVFADGLKSAREEAEREERHRKVLETLVMGSLVASGQYEEKVLFEEYFPAPELPEGIAADDSELNMDYSGVDFGVPSESEMEILQRMLADTSITVSDLDGPDEPVPASPALPAPREIPPGDIEQDREWV
jgi:hypothetical protein